jgi:hypothetical protein
VARAIWKHGASRRGRRAAALRQTLRPHHTLGVAEHATFVVTATAREHDEQQHSQHPHHRVSLLTRTSRNQTGKKPETENRKQETGNEKRSGPISGFPFSVFGFLFFIFFSGLLKTFRVRD